MRLNKRNMLAFFAVFGLAVLCTVGFVVAQQPGKTPTEAQDMRPVLVATTAHIADIVRHVAGDHVRLRTLIGEGIDPHLYRPTRTDMVTLHKADIVLYNGLNLEGQMTALLERLAATRPAMAVLSPSDPGIDPNDPHAWMDVRHWIGATDRVAAILSNHLPDHADDIMARAAAYKQQLSALDAYVRARIASIPEQRRVLVTAHDAFGYMGRTYNIEVVGIQGISTDSEAGLNHIEMLVTLLSERQIPSVFIESSLSDRHVRALIEGAAARGHIVTIGGMLYADALGTPGSYEGSYIGMMDHNATVIARALGGTAPDGGMANRLTIDRMPETD